MLLACSLGFGGTLQAPGLERKETHQATCDPVVTVLSGAAASWGRLVAVYFCDTGRRACEAGITDRQKAW